MTILRWKAPVWIRSALGATTALATASAIATGCSSSASPITPGNYGGIADTGSPNPANDAGASGEAGATTLYQRLGGHAGIRGAVDAIVAAELQNQDIASYFFFQAGAPANGHPTADQVEECFTDLVGTAAGGPESYPTTVSTDAGSFTCRSMTAIHAPLLISGGTFDTFIMIAGATLVSAGVSSTDVATLANALVATKPQVVTGSLADAGPEPFPGDGGQGQ
jgi:hypothetical protein